MILIHHPITSSTGISVEHHAVSRVELSQDMQDLLIWMDSWPAEQQRLDGQCAVAHWHLRVTAAGFEVGANMLDAVQAAVLASAEFSGATVIPDAALALDTARARKWAQIKAERAQRLLAAGSASNPPLDSDPAATVNITGVVTFLLAYPTTPSVEFTCRDNVRRTVPRDDFIAAAAVTLGAMQSVYDTADALRQQIAAAQSAEDVAAIAWP